MDECLSLTWNSHGVTYRKTLNMLRKENTLTDVTLACDGEKFTAHKLILVTCSEYFRSILGDVPCQHPIVYLRGVCAKEMRALIDFMYTGQTDVPQSDVPGLLSTAESLQIKGLGVLNNTAEEDASNRALKPHRKKVSEKRKNDHMRTPNGVYSESAPTPQRDERESTSSHFTAFIDTASPKRRKAEEDMESRSEVQSTLNEFSTYRDNTPKVSKDLHASQSTSSTAPYMRGCPQSPAMSNASDTLNFDLSKQSSEIPCEQDSDVTQRDSTRDENYLISGSRHETSPQALNYSLAGLSTDKDGVNMSTEKNRREDSSIGLPFGAEALAKIEVKNEALDFTNNALTENCAPDETGVASQVNIDDEARMYLDALTRSANLVRSLPVEENMEMPTGDQDRPFVCPICHKCFAKAAILKRHHLAHFRPYTCHLCARSFTRREVLAEHLLEHNGADLRLPCPVCNVTIKRKRNLQAHIKVKHPDYYCQKIASREAIC
ncbi:uncharacterized protein LOC143038807 [Oratosquilla oratoria]|uniref:uncharacterized protein LOC143038807 n=1 Tax=Oratosquilla oratoria TaxID=337810 RepID=UPI003F77266E